MAVKGVSKELKKEIFKTQVRNASLAERIAESRAAVKRYSDEEKKEIQRKAKAYIAKGELEKKEADRLARHEKIKAEAKAQIVKQKREKQQAKQDRNDFQGFSWEGKDYFVEWRGHKVAIPEIFGKKQWEWKK